MAIIADGRVVPCYGPILLGSVPIETPWSLGDEIATLLRWCDAPDLPGDVVMHQVRAHATVLISGDGRAWAQSWQPARAGADRQDHDQRVCGLRRLSAVGRPGARHGRDCPRLRAIMDLHDRAATDGVGAQPQDPGGGLVILLRERACLMRGGPWQSRAIAAVRAGSRARAGDSMAREATGVPCLTGGSGPLAARR